LGTSFVASLLATTCILDLPQGLRFSAIDEVFSLKLGVVVVFEPLEEFVCGFEEEAGGVFDDVTGLYLSSQKSLVIAFAGAIHS
jgi:hypothetical protein